MEIYPATSPNTKHCVCYTSWFSKITDITSTVTEMPNPVFGKWTCRPVMFVDFFLQCIHITYEKIKNVKRGFQKLNHISTEITNKFIIFRGHKSTVLSENDRNRLYIPKINFVQKKKVHFLTNRGLRFLWIIPSNFHFYQKTIYHYEGEGFNIN